MFISPATIAQMGVIVAQPQVSHWGRRVVTYPFSNPVVQKILMGFTALVVIGAVLSLYEPNRQQAEKPEVINPPEAENNQDRSAEKLPVAEPLSDNLEDLTLPEAENVKDLVAQKERLSELLPDIERRALVEKIRHLKEPVGLLGGGNNCFLNSCFQYIMHSDLCDFFLNPANLCCPCLNKSLENIEYDALGEKDKEYCCRFIRNQVSFYKAFVQFAKDYSNGKKDLSTGHFRSFMFRGSKTVEVFSQEDATEALNAFLIFYNTQSISHEYSRTIRKEHSELANGSEESAHIHQMPVVELDCPRTEADSISIKAVWKANFGAETLADPVDIDLTNRKSTAHQTTINTDLKLMSPELHMRVMKYTNQIGKLTAAIDFGGALSINFGGKDYYDLQCFMVHRGDSLTFGHYIAYTKLRGVWYCNNDTSVYVSDEDEVLKAAQDGYMFCYKKVEPLDNSDSDSSDAGSVLTEEDGHPVLSPRLKSIDLLSDEDSDNGSDGSVDSGDEGAKEAHHV